MEEIRLVRGVFGLWPKDTRVGTVSSEVEGYREGVMVRYLRELQLWLERIVECLGQLGGLVLFATVALVFINAFNRYTFAFSPVWTQELEWHLLAGQGALGIAYAWLHRDHIAVDVFSQHYSRTVQHWMQLLVAVVIAIPCSLFLIKVSFPYIDRAYEIMEGSPNPGGLPWRFVPKAFVALTFGLVALQALATAIKSGVELFAVEREIRVSKRD